jgi:hypothetical protein
MTYQRLNELMITAHAAAGENGKILLECPVMGCDWFTANIIRGPMYLRRHLAAFHSVA